MKHLVAIALALVTSRTAAADPELPHVLTAPTAWLPPQSSVVGTFGVDHRGDGSAEIGFGLGGLAAFELDADTDARACAVPPCAVNGTDNLAQTKWQARGAFRMGVRQDELFKGQPAAVLGFRTAFGHVRRLAEVYLVASRVIGLVRLHAGVAAMDAQHPADARMGVAVRPLAGLELTPPQYPKSTLMTDVAWIPRYQPDDPITMKTGNVPEWVIGLGVRYQALSWGSIELDVRAREGEGLGASTVIVRLNGVLGTVPDRK